MFQQKLSIGYWGGAVVGLVRLDAIFEYIRKSKYEATDEGVKINDKLNIWYIFLEDSMKVVVITEDKYIPKIGYSH